MGPETSGRVARGGPLIACWLACELPTTTTITTTTTQPRPRNHDHGHDLEGAQSPVAVGLGNLDHTVTGEASAVMEPY